MATYVGAVAPPVATLGPRLNFVFVFLPYTGVPSLVEVGAFFVCFESDVPCSAIHPRTKSKFSVTTCFCFSYRENDKSPHSQPSRPPERKKHTIANALPAPSFSAGYQKKCTHLDVRR